jgi:copper transport protein
LTQWGIVVVIVAVALGLPSGAAAHAVLVSSTPVDGAVVTRSPASIELVFSERIAQVGASLRLLGPDGAPIALATPPVDQRRLTALVEGDVDEGTSTLAWSIISADGHRISGALAFAVSSTPGAEVVPVGPVAATAPEASPRGATTVASVVRAIRFAAILAIIGLVAMLASLAALLATSAASKTVEIIC